MKLPRIPRPLLAVSFMLLLVGVAFAALPQHAAADDVNGACVSQASCLVIKLSGDTSGIKVVATNPNNHNTYTLSPYNGDNSKWAAFSVGPANASGQPSSATTYNINITRNGKSVATPFSVQVKGPDENTNEGPHAVQKPGSTTPPTPTGSVVGGIYSQIGTLPLTPGQVFTGPLNSAQTTPLELKGSNGFTGTVATLNSDGTFGQTLTGVPVGTYTASGGIANPGGGGVLTYSQPGVKITTGTNKLYITITRDSQGKSVVRITSTPPTLPGANSTPDKASCDDTGGFGLSWIICPIFNATAAFSDWVFQSLVQPFLRTSPISTDPSDPSFKVWSQFRVYGNVLLVIGLLVLVFGQSIGGGLIDAYTVKKSMPRILIAAILINLSVYIVAGLVDITNVVGGSIGKVMTDPLANAGAFQFTPSGVQSGAILGGLGGTTFAGAALFGVGTLAEGTIGSFLLLFVIMPVVLGLLAAFITLILRKAIILALVLVSPVAFALYCLPNTEKYFKKWWDFLVQTLLVYPIVIIIFAVADILSVTVVGADNTGGSRTVALIIAFVLQFLPLLMIPYAFKLAGGAVGLVHETLTNYHKRGQEAVKGNINDPLSLRNRTRTAAQETLGRRRVANIRGGQGVNANRGQRLRSRLAFGLPGGRNAIIGESRRNAAAQKLAEEMSATGDDAPRYAAVGFHHNAGDIAQSVLKYKDGTTVGVGQPIPAGRSSWFDGKGRQISDVEHSQGVATFGRGPAAAAQNLEYMLRKKQTDDDVGNFRHAFAQQAVAQNWSTGEAQGAWAAATFTHKGAIGSEWYSKPTVIAGPGGKAASVQWTDVSASDKAYNAFIKDPHNNRQSFELSKIQDADWRAMAKNQTDTEAIIADPTRGWASLTPEQQENYVMTAEVLETVSQDRGIQFNPELNEVTASGVSSASRPIVEGIFKNRKYGVTPTPQVNGAGNPTGNVSVDDRVVYAYDPVRTAEIAQAKGALSPLNVQQTILHNSVGTAKATGDVDRSNVGNTHTP